jgi:predicted aldo/keto reductase-like oxidoreductase
MQEPPHRRWHRAAAAGNYLADRACFWAACFSCLAWRFSLSDFPVFFGSAVGRDFVAMPRSVGPRPGRWGQGRIGAARRGTVLNVQTRRLGRTDHQSSLAVFGAASLWDADPDTAARVFGAALEAGVNHLDVAPRYGRAQELLGPLIPAQRHRLFVACKTQRRDPGGVRAHLEDSLRTLQCDHFDLYQMHAVTDRAELDARAGAVEAMLAARDEGLCRFVGITGHDLTAPATHAEALRRYDLDTVMFPVNPRLWADAAYRSDAEALLEQAAQRDVGVMAIKAAAVRPWGDRPHTAGTWYEPYTTADDVERGVRFTLSVPGVHAFCTPGDTGVLALALEAAEHFGPMDDAERAAASAGLVSEPHIFPMPRA